MARERNMKWMDALRDAWRRLNPWPEPCTEEDELDVMEADQDWAMRRLQARLDALGVEADVLGRGKA